MRGETFYLVDDDTLCHWKYISKKRNNGKWEYTYPEDVPDQKGTIGKAVDKGKKLAGKAVNAGKKLALKTSIGRDIQRKFDTKRLRANVEDFYNDAKKRYKQAFTEDQKADKTSNHTDNFYETIMKDSELRKKYNKIMNNRLTSKAVQEEWRTKQTQIPADKQKTKDYNDYNFLKNREKQRAIIEKNQMNRAKELAYKFTHSTPQDKVDQFFQNSKKQSTKKSTSTPAKKNSNAWDSDFFEKWNKKRRK